MFIFIIVILVALIVVLVMYNISIHKKIEILGNVSEKIMSLNVIQEFMDKVGEEMPSGEKIKGINEILINKYKLPYSTIVMFDGDKYTIRATNTEKVYWEILSRLSEQPIFKDSIQNAVPQKLEIKREGECLPYEKRELARAKSAIFFPLYLENVYIGYWIIEGRNMEDLRSLDLSEMEYVRNNIISIMKAIESQSVIENIIKEDKFTKLKSEEFLYSTGRKIINKYSTSTICMFEITNLESINKKEGREIGNFVIKHITEFINKDLDIEQIFIRYMGPKFVIAFSGKEQEFVANFMKDKKEQIEKLSSVNNKNISIRPRLNVAIATYYKGVALENVVKMLENYLETTDRNESDINFI